MRMNPFLDQGIDIRLCEGSCPMDEPDDVNILNGVEHIIERHIVPAWRTNDGELIAIKDMETSHIKNCIKTIYRRNGTWRQQYLRYFENELRRRRYEEI